MPGPNTMTAMDALIAFIEARLDEEEYDARDRARGNPGPWSVDASWVNDANGQTVVHDEYHWSPLPHIARYDPARVLREVAAKRVIAELHGREHDCPVIVPIGNPEAFAGKLGYVSTEHIGDEGDFLNGACTTLRELAAIWNDHPDYRREWLPAAERSA